MEDYHRQELEASKESNRQELEASKESHRQEIEAIRNKYHEVLYDKALLNARKMLEIFSKDFAAFHKDQKTCTHTMDDTYAGRLNHFLNCQAVDDNLRKAMKNIVTPQAGKKVHPENTRRSLDNPSKLYGDLSSHIHDALWVVDSFVELPYYEDYIQRRFLAALVVAVERRVRYRGKYGEIFPVEEDISSPEASPEATNEDLNK